MGKGNLLLGMGRGKLGDVVFARQNGQQQFRVRNRNPKNPKTTAQILQRALLATVSKAYSQMKEICDHSFEGKSVGEENQREFQRVNLNLLRSGLVYDVQNDLSAEQATTAVVKPKPTYATLNAYQVSQGTLVNNFLHASHVEGDLTIVLDDVPNENETVNAYLQRKNVVAGDIFTILVQSVILSGGDFASQYGQYASAPSTSFGFVRLTIKDGIADTLTCAAAKWGDVFTIDHKNVEFGNYTAAEYAFAGTSNLAPNAVGGGDTSGIAVIRSRQDSGKRSTERMEFVTDVTNSSLGYVSPSGIKHMYILNAWGDEVDSLGASDLILEGGGF